MASRLGGAAAWVPAFTSVLAAVLACLHGTTDAEAARRDPTEITAPAPKPAERPAARRPSEAAAQTRRLANINAARSWGYQLAGLVVETAQRSPYDLIVLDATTGQNALQQVEVFRDRAGVTGLVMTKLDGTARGGILVAIAAKFGLPVHAIGVGEGVDDLQPFDADEFARAIAQS